ncbi:MAG: TonB-dependent receptor [Planctomycetota bacterium]
MTQPANLLIHILGIVLCCSLGSVASAQEGAPRRELSSEGQGAGDEAQDTEDRKPAVASETVVTATRRPEETLEVPQAVSVVDAKELRERMPLTTPDALEEELGVVVQKTGPAGGSPILRGRTGKDVLLLLDGQRFNDATFRRNNQYLNTIDLSALDRIEIVRGPASVLYGSDAIGGAINLLTRRREVTGEDAIGGRVLGQFESAYLGWTGHIGLEGEIGGFGILGGVTIKRFGDLMAGHHGDPIGAVDIDGRQDPSSYREMDFSFSLVRPLSDKATLDFLYLHSRQNDVPRSDRLIANEKQAVPPDLVRSFDPQVLQWYQLRYRVEDLTDAWESLEVTGTFKVSEEERRRIRTSAPGVTIDERDVSFVPGITAQTTYWIGEVHALTGGLEFYDQTVHSSREALDFTTNGIAVDPDGRYPDGATYQSFGVYLQDEWAITDDVTWTNGVRYSAFRVHLDLENVMVGPLGPFGRFTETFDDVTFSTAVSVAVTEETSVYGSLAKGFRAPNIDDLAVIGDFASGERVPNLDVDPERVFALEVGAKHRTSRFAGDANAAVAWYDDLLDNRLAFVQGNTSFFQIDNVSRAIIYSFEAAGAYVVKEAEGGDPEHSIYVNAFANFGHNRTGKEPVSKIPPPQGQLGYRLDSKEDGWSAEAFLRGALEQNRLSTADESDPRFPIGGTPTWWTFNLRGAIELTKNLRVALALENIFDQRYRVHGSGLDAPGFNAVVQVEAMF